jgi:hypothetical protein
MTVTGSLKKINLIMLPTAPPAVVQNIFSCID